MRFKASRACLACVVSVLGLAACSGSPGDSTVSGPGGGSSSLMAAAPCTSGVSNLGNSSSDGGSKTTLTMEQSPVSSVTRDFNPFIISSPGSTLGLTDMLYEPLLQFDMLKPGAYYPWLASGYTWSNQGKTISFPIRGGVKFTDGEAFTAKMAAWEFSLIAHNNDINPFALPITGATAVGNTLVINFSSSQYTNLYNIANTVMVPEGIWSKAGDPGRYDDANPVGSGPYTMKTFSPAGVLLTRNASYWQGESQVPQLYFPAYSGNTTADAALENGSLQWAGNFVRDIQSQFLGKSPNNHCWDVGLQTETLIPNLTRFPFAGPGGLAVRQAISYGIDRQAISSVGEDGQQPPVEGPGSLTGLTLPLQQAYVTQAVAGDVAKRDVAKAKSILQDAGWTMGSNGYFAKNGQTLAFTIEDPLEYSDFISDDTLMARQLKAVGIQVTVKKTTVPDWNKDLADGNFDSIARWGNGGISPYNMYDNWLDTTLDSNPSGATGNYERFSGPDAVRAEADLKAYAAAKPSATGTPTAQEIGDVDALGAIVARDLPVIPLFYGVAWDDFNDSNWTGWPTPANPFEPAQPNSPMNEVTVLHLRPKN